MPRSQIKLGVSRLEKNINYMYSLSLTYSCLKCDFFSSTLADGEIKNGTFLKPPCRFCDSVNGKARPFNILT
jgi:hypothetical protein